MWTAEIDFSVLAIVDGASSGEASRKRLTWSGIISMALSVQPYSVQTWASMVFVSTLTAPVSMGCLYLVHRTMEETELLLPPAIGHCMIAV